MAMETPARAAAARKNKRLVFMVRLLKKKKLIAPRRSAGHPSASKKLRDASAAAITNSI
jgi:hypothetical protein